ncbi:MAG: hypothetical protein HZB33_12900 [Nitrospirae bacterium]|nr:hypothetical protein [Nitrospirota bacterium]
MEKKTDAEECPGVPISFVPTPTDEYRRHRKIMKATVQPGIPKIPVPLPMPKTKFPPVILPGARVLIWKQDPTVTEIGVRKAYLPRHIFAGPRDSRINSQGLPTVSPNAFGDMIQTPGTDAFDAVHTFAVVRQTLTMCQRAGASGSAAAQMPWQWNSATVPDPLNVFAHGLPDVMNAFYSRGEKALKFGDFIRPGSSPAERIYTCRSFDIVAHETGHAILDGLKPGWLLSGNPPQTGGLHESFGDLVAIFLALSQFDQVEAAIAQTKANLHDKTFLSDMAEQFGLALGRPNGLRNADNDLKLSEAGTEVHAISQVFTGAIYDILSDIFSFEKSSAVKDDASVLYTCGQYLFSLVLRAIIASPHSSATYAHVANQMLAISLADGKPVQYRNYIRNRFTVREVVVSATPLTANIKDGVELAPHIEDAPGAVQDRRGCCGTMNLQEYFGEGGALHAEIEEFKKSLK